MFVLERCGNRYRSRNLDFGNGFTVDQATYAEKKIANEQLLFSHILVNDLQQTLDSKAHVKDTTRINARDDEQVYPRLRSKIDGVYKKSTLQEEQKIYFVK